MSVAPHRKSFMNWKLRQISVDQKVKGSPLRLVMNYGRVLQKTSMLQTKSSGQAEVGELDQTSGVDQQILRFQVPSFKKQELVFKLD